MTLAHRGAGDVSGSGVLPTSVISAAREASLRGDFEACLTLLDRTTDSEELRAESLFLRARALLRLQRPQEAVRLLEPALETFVAADEDCTARMLYAHALARIERSSDRGLRMLEEAAIVAELRRADRAIQNEIAYYRALAHWVRQEYPAADRLAATVEAAHADVLSVRATQLRGFVASAMTRFSEALTLFRRAHFAYSSCRGRDIDLATQILLQIASLEMTLRSAAVPGTHAKSGGRTIAGTTWGPAVASPARMFLCLHDAWLFAHDGDDRRAFQKARETEEIAPTVAWRSWALSCRAIIATMFGETAAGRDFADNARELQSGVEWSSATDEERIALLRLAEVYAYVAPEEAGAVLRSYEAVSVKIDSQRMASNGTDPRLTGWETYVRGLVARCDGDLLRADAHLRAAVDTFRSCGYLWREAFALIELDATPAQTRGNAYLEMAAQIIRDNFPRSFLAHRLGPWARMYFDPIASTLTPAQRDVLRHLLGGLSPREIAERTNRASGTVENHVKRLHAAFGTHSIGQLFHECNRRGIGVPTWWTERSKDGGPFGWVEHG